MRLTIVGVVVMAWGLVGSASGQVLARPPANLRDVAVPVLERVVAEHPEAWACAHVEGRACRADWINLAASELHAIDRRFGLNGKRGNPSDLSLDVITYLLDPENPRKVAAWDVCQGCGAPGARVVWSDITDYRPAGPGVLGWGNPGTAIWIQPEPRQGGGGSGGGGSGGGGSAGSGGLSAADLRPLVEALARLEAELGEVRRLAADAVAGARQAAEFAEHANANASDIRHNGIPAVSAGLERLGLAGCLVGRVPKAFGGSSEVRFCPAGGGQ